MGNSALFVPGIPHSPREPLLGETAVQETRVAFVTLPTVRSPVLCRTDCTPRPWRVSLGPFKNRPLT